ncbi:hypothetical protein ADK82_18620 [Streptomyces sp. NRRL S-4]|nr:hypothetical protein ADK82_18620 [Streptomyces sp. NRRL S-4]
MSADAGATEDRRWHRIAAHRSAPAGAHHSHECFAALQPGDLGSGLSEADYPDQPAVRRRPEREPGEAGAG